MGLPDRDSAKTWGGKLLVDRDGTEIGTCTQVFVDDATGLPEWAQADVSGGPAVVPLLDAAESGDLVRVAVRQADVAVAPRIDDPGHISQDEEERLYHHYGIEFSSETSESLLPVDEPAGQGTSEPGVPEVLVPPEPTTGFPPVEPTSGNVDGPGEYSPGRNRRGLLTSLGAGAVGVLAAAAAAVFWWRQRHQAPPARKDLLAARARAASLALATKKDQVGTSASPLVRSGRRLSAAARRQAAVQARWAAEWAAVQARAAAQQAAALAATARTIRLQRVVPDADIERQAAEAAATAAARQRKARLLDVLETVGGFAAGYAVANRRSGDGERPGQPGQRRQLQEMAGRVQGRVTGTLQAGNAQLSQRAGAVASKVRRRSGEPGDTA